MADSGTNIHLENQATPTINPVIMPEDMKSRVKYGRTMDSSHVATLQLPGIIKQYRQCHIIPKMRKAPLIWLGVLCDNGCTIKLEQQEVKVPKKRTTNIKRYQEQTTRIVVISPGGTTIKNCGK